MSERQRQEQRGRSTRIPRPRWQSGMFTMSGRHSNKLHTKGHNLKKHRFMHRVIEIEDIRDIQVPVVMHRSLAQCASGSVCWQTVADGKRPPSFISAPLWGLLERSIYSLAFSPRPVRALWSLGWGVWWIIEVHTNTWSLCVKTLNSMLALNE